MIQTGELITDQSQFDADATFTAAQAGDAEAFGELYRHCAPQIHTQLMRLSRGDESLAEDLTQDTFAKALAAQGGFLPGNVKGWLHRIAHNNYLDHYRHQGRYHLEPMGSDLSEVQPYIRPLAFEDEVITRLDLDDYIREVAESLSEEQRGALIAVGLLDLTADEAVGLLSIKRAATLRTRLHRGRVQAQKIPVPEGYHPSRHFGESPLVEDTDRAGSD